MPIGMTHARSLSDVLCVVNSTRHSSDTEKQITLFVFFLFRAPFDCVSFFLSLTRATASKWWMHVDAHETLPGFRTHSDTC
jgi:hypothetical protein